MAPQKPPMTWTHHSSVLGRWKTGDIAACTLERVAGDDGLFVVKRWAQGLKTGQTQPMTFEGATHFVQSLRVLAVS